MGLASALAAGVVLAAPASALGVERITSPFLLEYSSQSYSIDQGEIVTFANEDPFLRHGLVSDLGFPTKPAFEAPVISRAQVRLVRGAPFLPRGGSPYRFRDPAHPGMTATLVVTTAGTPLPPDAIAPQALLKILSGGLGRVARSGKLRLMIAPSEAVDAVIKASFDGTLLGRAERTYVNPGRKGFGLKLTGGLPGKGSPRVRVAVSLTDVAGNSATVKVSRRLRGPLRKGK